VNKENMVYIHIDLLDIKKNGIILFAGKWMEMEIIMLSEIN
jgi:hypothetical protein